MSKLVYEVATVATAHLRAILDNQEMIMFQTSYKSCGFIALTALAVMFSHTQAASAQGIVTVNNPTNLNVYYWYSFDGGVTFAPNPASLPPYTYQEHTVGAGTLTVRLYAGPVLKTFNLPETRGRLFEYFFWPIPGGVDLYGPRRIN